MRSMWNMFQEVENLRREVDRAFQNAFRSNWQSPMFRFAFRPAAESAGGSAYRYPLLNISEDDANVYVDALAPGLDPKSLNIQVVQNQLQIAGEKAPDQNIQPEAYHRNERGVGRFARTIALPTDVEQDKAAAEYKNGILRVTLPKAEAAKPKQININVA